MIEKKKSVLRKRCLIYNHHTIFQESIRQALIQGPSEMVNANVLSAELKELAFSDSSEDVELIECFADLISAEPSKFTIPRVFLEFSKEAEEVYGIPTFQTEDILAIPCIISPYWVEVNLAFYVSSQGSQIMELGSVCKWLEELSENHAVLVNSDPGTINLIRVHLDYCEPTHDRSKARIRTSKFFMPPEDYDLRKYISKAYYP